MASHPFRFRSIVVVALAWLMVTSASVAQSLRFQAETAQMYAEVPFVLSLTADGFAEQPTPAQPGLVIDGCEVTPIGVTPNVSSMIRIVNGRRSESQSVTFVYRYQVLAPKVGTYTIQPTELTQDGRTARTTAASFTVSEVASSDDMRIRMNLPDRPIWLGETVPITIDWLLRRDPSSQNFFVPLFDRPDVVQVQPAPARGRQTLAFTAGGRPIDLPYEREPERIDGGEFTRFRFHAVITASRAGAVELEPIRVAAELEVAGERRSFFRTTRRELFKAAGVRQRLSVRSLPVKGRPTSFEDAIGTAFSIRVQASRTVVRAGDPIELDIEVRGDGRLEGLSLPPLDADGGFAPELFSIPGETPTGQIDEEGKVKTFRVTVRLKSVEAREIPPIALSYFDPTAAEYRTVYSQPIALQVAGTALVGAADVVGARPSDEPGPGPGATADDPKPTVGVLPGSLVGADLSLSASTDTLLTALSLDDVRPLVWLLYLIPLAILGGRFWLVRTSASRGRSSETRSALGEARAAIAAASAGRARDSGPRLVSALRAVTRLGGHRASELTALVERIETEAFNPRAADEPLPAGLLAEAGRLLQEVAGPSVVAGVGGLVLPLAVVLGLQFGAPGFTTASEVAAEPTAVVGTADPIATARAIYQNALLEKERARRTRLFADAERELRTLAVAHPDRPSLLTDWGNAALGAQDLGRATLAYRRALRLDPTHEKASKNLAWVRGRAPRWLPTPSTASAVDTLFFWHHRLSVAERHLAGAAAFALMILLVTPWGLGAARARTLRRLAILPLALWIAMTGSALLERGAAGDGVVVVDGYTLRSADSLGAPAALSKGLPAGAEVRILETRDSWTRVALADGTRGWLSAVAVEAIVP